MTHKSSRSYRLGLLARADNTGLGHQTLEFYRHMKPDKTMVVDMTHLKGNHHYPESRYPGCKVSTALPEGPVTLPPEDISEFLEDLDVVFTAESPYSPLLYVRARRRGVLTVCQPNFDQPVDKESYCSKFPFSLEGSWQV